MEEGAIDADLSEDETQQLAEGFVGASAASPIAVADSAFHGVVADGRGRMQQHFKPLAKDHVTRLVWKQIPGWSKKWTGRRDSWQDVSRWSRPGWRMHNSRKPWTQWAWKRSWQNDNDWSSHGRKDHWESQSNKATFVEPEIPTTSGRSLAPPGPLPALPTYHGPRVMQILAQGPRADRPTCAVPALPHEKSWPSQAARPSTQESSCGRQGRTVRVFGCGLAQNGMRLIELAFAAVGSVESVSSNHNAIFVTFKEKTAAATAVERFHDTKFNDKKVEVRQLLVRGSSPLPNSTNGLAEDGGVKEEMASCTHSGACDRTRSPKRNNHHRKRHRCSHDRRSRSRGERGHGTGKHHNCRGARSHDLSRRSRGHAREYRQRLSRIGTTRRKQQRTRLSDSSPEPSRRHPHKQQDSAPSPSQSSAPDDVAPSTTSDAAAGQGASIS